LVEVETYDLVIPTIPPLVEVENPLLPPIFRMPSPTFEASKCILDSRGTFDNSIL
jgi:hypothetical protein